jgi:hypothetical protein
LAAPLVDALTDLDESRRQAAARHVQQTCIPAAVALVCRLLVERLLAGPAGVRRSARASLVQVGAAALPALYGRLLCTRGAGTQVALVGALAAIGQGLSPRVRVDLMLDLMIVRGRAIDDSARQAIDGAVATLRRLQPPPVLPWHLRPLQAVEVRRPRPHLRPLQDLPSQRRAALDGRGQEEAGPARGGAAELTVGKAPRLAPASDATPSPVASTARGR